MKIIRNVFTRDAPIGWLAPTKRHREALARDSRLEAVPVGKMLVSGTTWEGDLKPQIDRHLDQVEAFLTPFTLNRLLHAESSSAPLDVGRTWVGDLIEYTDKTAANSARSAANDVDLSAVRQGLEVFHQTLGTRPFDATAYEEALREVRDAAAAVSAASANRRTNDARAEAQATRARVTEINERNRAYWANATSRATTADSVGAVRDAVHAAHTATHMRDKIQAIQAAHDAFWSGRGNSANTRDGFAAPRQLHPIERHAQTTPADINARNRAFWNQR